MNLDLLSILCCVIGAGIGAGIGCWLGVKTAHRLWG